MNSVITIGRQFGSDGRAIGEKLSKEYGIPFYDKEILVRASKESGLCEELFKDNDEKKSGSFLFSLAMDSSFLGYGAGFSTGEVEMPLSQKIFLAQFDTIKNIAHEGPCIIVGRCADYVLEEEPNLVSVFIHASFEDRVRRVMERDSLPEKKAINAVMKNDKERMSYYNYYTNNRWGDANNYNLSIDSGLIGIDGCVDVIRKYVETAESKRK
ncbi:MAG: cytidylate kinase-like family protein [Lachnospiraceae bacterium]|nr:cytidylate kinase-like family protein [Lachnospiraceae bacterium]